MGTDCYIINYTYPNQWHYSIGFKKPNLKNKVAQIFGSTSIYIAKQKKLQAFQKKNIFILPKNIQH